MAPSEHDGKDLPSEVVEEGEQTTMEDETMAVDDDENETEAPKDQNSGSESAEFDTYSPRKSATSGQRGRRGRKRGRGGVRRVDSIDRDSPDNTSEVGSPRKGVSFNANAGSGGRGRGGNRSGRSKISLSAVEQIPQDREGNEAVVVDDDAVLPEDPEGEAKITKDGDLLCDREFRVRTFRIEGRGDRAYMLANEPARCMGFRDIFSFFDAHKQLVKIILDEYARRTLIQRGILPSTFRARYINVVTARSVFREFGAQIILNGKKIVDDYYVSEARERGDVEGEIADPEDGNLYCSMDGFSSSRPSAWPSEVTSHSNGDYTDLAGAANPGNGGRGLLGVTDSFWMIRHARSASRFNAVIAAQRKDTLRGLYNINTNCYHYPKHMQPTRARWEPILEKSRGDDSISSRLDSPLPYHAHKLFISDSIYESPRTSTWATPGSDTNIYDPLSMSLSNVDASIVNGLPEECQLAFKKARDSEQAWQKKWASPVRRQTQQLPKVTYNV